LFPFFIGVFGNKRKQNLSVALRLRGFAPAPTNSGGKIVRIFHDFWKQKGTKFQHDTPLMYIYVVYVSPFFNVPPQKQQKAIQNDTF